MSIEKEKKHCMIFFYCIDKIYNESNFTRCKKQIIKNKIEQF